MRVAHGIAVAVGFDQRELQPVLALAEANEHGAGL